MRGARGGARSAGFRGGAGLRGTGLILCAAALLLLAPAASGAETLVIALTQTGCQFLEPEGGDRGFRPERAADCRRVNAETGARRLAAARTMTLRPGRYVFRVTNRSVPYELGFYLRGTGVGRLTLPKVSGGGIARGRTRDYAVTLTEGEYRYSCPLNPTPDYRLRVRN